LAWNETSFWEVLSAISGPIAGSIALYTAYLASKRADARQSREWKKAKRLAKKNAITKAETLNDRLSDELIFIAKFLDEKIVEGMILTPEKFNLAEQPDVPKRPMHENIGQFVLHIDKSTYKAIGVMERFYEKAVEEYNRVTSVPLPATNDTDKQLNFMDERQIAILDAMKKVVNASVEYITILAGSYETHEYEEFTKIATKLEVSYYQFKD
jgi:hypothetical protein